MTRTASLLATVALLAGCSVAPHYARPASATAATWKTVDGWRAAAPADDAVRADWWSAFGDPMLDGLVAREDRSNQTLAQGIATYREATALTREARANLFPTVSANGSVTHSYSGSGRVINGDIISSATGAATGTGATGATGGMGTGLTTGAGTTSGTSTGGTTTGIVSSGSNSTSYRLTLQATWQPDFFGRLTNTVRNARYTEQARLADLANTRLTLQGQLVSDYLSLRGADADLASLTATVDAYRRSFTIASNRYTAGIAPRTDVFQAQSQLASAQSDLQGERRARAQFEDAIAVLIGENPATYRVVALSNWTPSTPAVPVALPSLLVERRPDIASAERQVAAANAQVGVQRAAFFPTVTLSGNGGVQSEGLSSLFNASSLLWSLGSQVAQTLLDFGARRARVAQARFAYDATVANYRQVTLVAFQEVQDDLIATQILGRQEAFLQTASTAADRSEAALRNQYLAGTTVYTNVVAAQATALTARRALIQGRLDRQNGAVSLVQALGGGWSAADLTNGAARTAALAPRGQAQSVP